MFTRHAPTVLNMIARFNQDIDDCLKGGGWVLGRADTTAKAKVDALRVLRQWLRAAEEEGHTPAFGSQDGSTPRPRARLKASTRRRQ
jgi:hypothetical protein